MKKLQEGFKKLIEGKGKSSSTAGKGNAANNQNETTLRSTARSTISNQNRVEKDDESNEFGGIGKTFAGVFPAIKNFMTKLEEKDKAMLEAVKDLNLLANDNPLSRNDA